MCNAVSHQVQHWVDGHHHAPALHLLERDPALRSGECSGQREHVGDVALAGECLRLGLADEVCYSILPIVIGDGISFFEGLDREIALHLADVKSYQSGMVELRYEVKSHRSES